MTTVDKIEIEKFSRMAQDWWNPNGKFKPLHLFNPPRISFIRDKLIIIRPAYLLFYWLHNIYNLFCTLQNKIALIINEEVYGFTDFRKTRVGNWRQSRIR